LSKLIDKQHFISPRLTLTEFDSKYNLNQVCMHIRVNELCWEFRGTQAKTSKPETTLAPGSAQQE